MRAITNPLPAGGVSMDDAVISDHDFGADFRTDDQWNAWFQLLHDRRLTALRNDIQDRDRRLISMNATQQPTNFVVGSWVRVATPNDIKTAPQYSAPLRISASSAHGRQFTLEDPDTGLTQEAGVQSIISASPPDLSQPAPHRPQANTTATPRVSLVTSKDGKPAIVDATTPTDTKTPCRIYHNTRPGRNHYTAHSAAKWAITLRTLTPTTVHDTFHMVINKSGNLVLPLAIRQRYPKLTQPANIY
jgi:hypothetical protein